MKCVRIADRLLALRSLPADVSLLPQFRLPRQRKFSLASVNMDAAESTEAAQAIEVAAQTPIDYTGLPKVRQL